MSWTQPHEGGDVPQWVKRERLRSDRLATSLVDINTLALLPDGLSSEASPSVTAMAQSDLEAYIMRAFPCQPRHLSALLGRLRALLRGLPQPWVQTLPGPQSRLPTAVASAFDAVREVIRLSSVTPAEREAQGGYKHRLAYRCLLKELKSAILRQPSLTLRVRLNTLFAQLFEGLERDWYGETWRQTRAQDLHAERFAGIALDAGFASQTPSEAWSEDLCAGIASPLILRGELDQNAILRVDKAFRYGLQLLTSHPGAVADEAEKRVRDRTLEALRAWEEGWKEDVTSWEAGWGGEEAVESVQYLKRVCISVFRSLVSPDILPALVFRLANKDQDVILHRLLHYQDEVRSPHRPLPLRPTDD